jgi:hypothetical protein
MSLLKPLPNLYIIAGYTFFVLLVVIQFVDVEQFVASASVRDKPPSQTSNQEYERIGYLITVNETSPRTIRSKQILTDAGFAVQLEFAPLGMESGALSNKMAQLAIYNRIIEDKSRPWGYVFEDDIAVVGKSHENWTDKVEFSVGQDLTRNGTGVEFLHSDYLYLGICGPKMYEKDRYCGFCAHAYGISREGAK